MFEFWRVWAFFGPARPRDQGETLPRTRFTPSALVRRSGDPNRTILMPKIGFCRLLKSRSPFKVDRIWRPPPIYFKGEVCNRTDFQKGPVKNRYTPLLKSKSGPAPKSDLLLRAIYF